RRRLGDLDLARTYALLAIERIEQLHTHLEAERLGPSWSNRTHQAFVELADMLLESHLRSGERSSLETAFEILERSRAISLRQRLGNELPRDTVSLEEERQLRVLSNIADMVARTGDAGIPRLQTLNYYHQRDLLALSRLARGETLPLRGVSSLAAVERRLRPVQMALYYLTADTNAYLLAITREGTELASLGDSARLITLLAQAERSIRAANGFA